MSRTNLFLKIQVESQELEPWCLFLEGLRFRAVLIDPIFDGFLSILYRLIDLLLLLAWRLEPRSVMLSLFSSLLTSNLNSSR